MATARCRSGEVRMLAAATASWTARLIPTPPIGDMACAASPMHNSPARYHRRRRSTRTVRSLISSQSRSSLMRSRANGMSRRDLVAQGRQPPLPDLVGGSLRDDIRALPVVSTVDHRQDPAGLDAAEALLWIARPPRQPQPQRIYRRTEVDDLEAGLLAHRRMAPIRPDGQIGANLEYTLPVCWRQRRRSARRRGSAP